MVFWNNINAMNWTSSKRTLERTEIIFSSLDFGKQKEMFLLESKINCWKVSWYYPAYWLLILKWSLNTKTNICKSLRRQILKEFSPQIFSINLYLFCNWVLLTRYKKLLQILFNNIKSISAWWSVEEAEKKKIINPCEKKIPIKQHY